MEGQHMSGVTGEMVCVRQAPDPDAVRARLQVRSCIFTMTTYMP